MNCDNVQHIGAVCSTSPDSLRRQNGRVVSFISCSFHDDKNRGMSPSISGLADIHGLLSKQTHRATSRPVCKRCFKPKQTTPVWFSLWLKNLLSFKVTSLMQLRAMMAVIWLCILAAVNICCCKHNIHTSTVNFYGRPNMLVNLVDTWAQACIPKYPQCLIHLYNVQLKLFIYRKCQPVENYEAKNPPPS